MEHGVYLLVAVGFLVLRSIGVCPSGIKACGLPVCAGERASWCGAEHSCRAGHCEIREIMALSVCLLAPVEEQCPGTCLGKVTGFPHHFWVWGGGSQSREEGGQSLSMCWEVRLSTEQQGVEP